MSLGQAHDFIKQGMKDAELRRALNRANSPDELSAILEQKRLIFTTSEFEDAFHHLLTQCQFEEQADELREFKMWWDMTAGMVQHTENAQPSG